MTKKLITVMTFLGLVSLTGVSFAGPPLITDDAGTVEVGKFEVEFNNAYTYNKERADEISLRRDAHEGEIKINTGLYKHLGLSVRIPYTYSDRVTANDQLVAKADGFGDIAAELKYTFAEIAGVSLAIKPVVTMPTGKYSAGLSEGRWRLGGTLIATKEFEDGKYAVHANVGYDHHDYRTEEGRADLRNNLWFASVAGEAKVAHGLTLATEFIASPAEERGEDALAVYSLTGFRYELNEHIDLNAGIKFGMTKPSDQLTVLYGLVVKF